MKVIGIILIVAGVLMLTFKSFNFTKEEKVVDIGPVEINKKEKKKVEWPMYAGIAVIVGGIALVALGAKKK